MLTAIRHASSRSALFKVARDLPNAAHHLCVRRFVPQSALTFGNVWQWQQSAVAHRDQMPRALIPGTCSLDRGTPALSSKRGVRPICVIASQATWDATGPRRQASVQMFLSLLPPTTLFSEPVHAWAICSRLFLYSGFRLYLARFWHSSALRWYSEALRMAIPRAVTIVYL